MEGKLICLDTSILIEYFRKKKKEKRKLYLLSKMNYNFAISVITEFEILIGSNDNQKLFWEELFSNFIIIPLDSDIINQSTKINKQLKQDRKQIDIPDLFIGASAHFHKLPLATNNYKHFNRIKGLELFNFDNLI